MPVESYNEYREDSSELMQSEIDTAINHAKSDLNDLQSEILWWKKVDFKTPDSINHFYELDKENGKVVFKLDQIKNYLSDVHKRLSWMKNQKFSEISKENNFTWTILAIQIALKAMETDPKNPKKYNIKKINWDYDETKEAIKIFQSERGLEWDGKPWKKTIETMIKALENFINNRKEYSDTKKIIKDSFAINATWAMRAWARNSEETINSMTDYIMKWNIGTDNDPELEKQINELANHPLNTTLQRLIKEKKENGKLNTLNLDERFNNTKYDNYIVQYAKQYSENYKVDPALIKIIMYKESRFNPKARSGAWAKWLMQLMPIAVKEVNKDKKIIRNVYDPKQNIEWWIKLFSNHLKTFKWNISLALAAYNAGAGSVKKAWNKVPNNRETKNYVKFITNEYNKLRA